QPATNPVSNTAARAASGTMLRRHPLSPAPCSRSLIYLPAPVTLIDAAHAPAPRPGGLLGTIRRAAGLLLPYGSGPKPAAARMALRVCAGRRADGAARVRRPPRGGGAAQPRRALRVRRSCATLNHDARRAPIARNQPWPLTP